MSWQSSESYEVLVTSCYPLGYNETQRIISFKTPKHPKISLLLWVRPQSVFSTAFAVRGDEKHGEAFTQLHGPCSSLQWLQASLPMYQGGLDLLLATHILEAACAASAIDPFLLYSDLLFFSTDSTFGREDALGYFAAFRSHPPFLLHSMVLLSFNIVRPQSTESVSNLPSRPNSCPKRLTPCFCPFLPPRARASSQLNTLLPAAFLLHFRTPTAARILLPTPRLFLFLFDSMVHFPPATRAARCAPVALQRLPHYSIPPANTH